MKFSLHREGYLVPMIICYSNGNITLLVSYSFICLFFGLLIYSFCFFWLETPTENIIYMSSTLFFLSFNINIDYLFLCFLQLYRGMCERVSIIYKM